MHSVNVVSIDYGCLLCDSMPPYCNTVYSVHVTIRPPLQLQVEQLTESLTQYEEANKVLSEQLSAQRKLASDKEKTMQRFEKKLGRIRSAIITEVNKVSTRLELLHNQY